MTQAKARKQTVSVRVREARLKSGLTQEGLARAAGLTTPALSRIERGVTPRISTLERLALALGLKPADLLGGGDER